MSGTNSNVLEVLQNRCLRILALAEPRTHNVHLRELLRIPALSDRRKYFFLCEMYKLNNNIGPIITHQNQNQLHIVTRNTRSTTASSLYMPRMNKSVGQRSLDYLGPCTFNSLPKHMKKLKELGTSRTHSAVIRCLTICQHIPVVRKNHKNQLTQQFDIIFCLARGLALCIESKQIMSLLSCEPATLKRGPQLCGQRCGPYLRH